MAKLTDGKPTERRIELNMNAYGSHVSMAVNDMAVAVHDRYRLRMKARPDFETFRVDVLAEFARVEDERRRAEAAEIPF